MVLRLIDSFRFDEIVHLIQYLADQSDQPPVAEFSIKAVIHQPENTLLSGLVENSHLSELTLKLRVKGVRGVQNIMSQGDIQVFKLSWKGVGGQAVTIDCLNREVHVTTDSISFLELIRHKLTGQQPRALTANLLVR